MEDSLVILGMQRICLRKAQNFLLTFSLKNYRAKREKILGLGYECALLISNLLAERFIISKLLAEGFMISDLSAEMSVI